MAGSRGVWFWSWLWTLLAGLAAGEAIGLSDGGSTTETTSHGLLANYIAAGIGIANDHATSQSSTSPKSSAAIHPNSTHFIGSAINGLLATGTLKNSTNNTLDEACWNQWFDYWSSTAPYSVPAATSWVVVTDKWAYEPYLTTTTWISENSWTLTSLSTEYSGDYPIAVHTSLTTSMGGGDWMTVTKVSTITTTSLRSYRATDWERTTRSGVTTPVCQLPSLVPQCESQWSSYMAEQDTITNELTPKPACTQASVKSSDCKTLVSQYLFEYTWNGETEGAGYQTSNGSTYWPTSKSFAPGCSLGCRACSITGQSVQLYWWPPQTKRLVENGTATASLTAGPGHTSGPVSLLVDGTYLTSPTVYISYDTLYASDSCSGIGPSYTNTIIPLAESAHLFSMETRWDPSISVHGFKTVPFNYSDLIEPIPNSIYNKQVRCQRSYTDFIKSGGLRENRTFSCARTGPYAPILAVPEEVQSLDPEWVGCEAWYGGLYDPPLALQPASVEATPTLPAIPSTTQASPSQAVDPGSPVATAASMTLGDDSGPLGSSQDGAEVIAGIFATSSTARSEPEYSFAPEPTSQAGLKTTLTLDGQTYSVDRKDGSIFVNGMKAQVDSVVTVSGHAFSIGSSVMAVDDTTIAYAAAPQSTAPDEAIQTSAPKPGQSVLTLGGQTYDIEAKSGSLFINGMQAETGHVATVSGHVFSAGPWFLAVDGTPTFTYALPTGSGLVNDASQIAEFDINGHPVTAEKEDGGAVINGKTYSNGQEATISGSPISIGSDGVVVGTSTLHYSEGQSGSSGLAVVTSSSGPQSSSSSVPQSTEADQTSPSTTSSGVGRVKSPLIAWSLLTMLVIILT